jgi:SAM-dependent methyltransferase
LPKEKEKNTMDAWFEQSFGQDYLLVYKHRNMEHAQEEVHEMIRWLALDEGAEVLDLCCGMGRHSLALTEAGYKITGMDLSDVLLAEAKRLDDGRRVKWVKGDMRNVPLTGPFDAVVNLFTSFGYFEDDGENARVLTEISRLLKPGGRFLIDFLNAGQVKAHLVPASERTDGSVLIRENRSIEDGYVKKRIVIAESGKPDRKYLEQVKLYGLPDFRRMMQGTGLRLDAIHGNYDGSAFAEESSPRLILLGTKE